jgi:thymidylate synthase ThyX
MTITAEIICDSVSPQGHRLTTMRLRYPKWIHSEFMTHRVFSRNASSSRAIPTAKYLEEVRSDELRAAPVWWGRNQAGMQAAEELSDEKIHPDMLSPRKEAQKWWKIAALGSAAIAEDLLNIGAHKQIVNRILEPFVHINVVVTATEWDNFFALRLHKDAQPEMRALALEMSKAMAISTPRELKPGEWHLPFVDQTEDVFVLQDFAHVQEMAIKVSVARCARVSYMSHDTGKRSTVEEDLKLYDRLKASGHWSPFEHQATPDEWRQGWSDALGRHPDHWAKPRQHGNFHGWVQHRKMLPGEAIYQP